MLPPMRVLHRHVLAECVPTLGLFLAGFTFVLWMHSLFKLSDRVLPKGVPVGQVLRLLLPVSPLLTVLLTMGRLSADSELTARRAREQTP